MKSLVVALVLIAAPVFAQEPVREVPDIISWGTAAVNPMVGVYKAWKSPNPQCQFSRLLLSGGVTTAGFIAHHFIDSPRPCVGMPGCSRGNGMPSTHSWWAQVGGASWKLQFSIPVGAVTPVLRIAAKEHTSKQAIWGTIAGWGGEALSHWLVKCDD